MRFHFIRRAPHDVHAAAIRLPSGNSRSEMLVGIGDTAVVLFFEIIVRKIRIAAAAQPELLDELLALFVGFQLQESLALFGRDYVDNVLVEPLLVRGVQFLERFLEFSLLFLVELLRGRRVGIASVLRQKGRGKENYRKECKDRVTGHPQNRETSNSRTMAS